MKGLKKKVKSGLKYVVIFNLFNKVLTFIITVVLARMLLPKDFGMIALAFLVIGAISLLNNFGLGEAIIQSRNNVRKIYSSAFLLSMTISIIAVIISFLLAEPISSFYGKPELASLIRFLSFVFIIDSLGLIPSAILERNMEFSKKLVPETLPIIFYALLSILLAMNGFGYWSMAIAHLASRVVQTVTLWIIKPWKPSFSIDMDVTRYLLRFGKEMILVSIFLFLLIQGDNAVIGKVLGVEALGFYALAYGLASLPATNFVNIVSRVTLPAYAKIKNNREILRNAFIKVLNYVYILAMPISVGLILLSREITLTVYGEKWAPIMIPLMILSVFGLFRAVASSSGSLFIAIGRPDVLKRITRIQLMIMVLTIYPLTKFYGIIGTSVCVTFAHLISIILIFRETSRTIDVPVPETLKAGKAPLFASAVMAISLVLLRSFFFGKTLLTNTVILVILGAAVYIMMMMLIEKDFLKNRLKELI